MLKNTKSPIILVFKEIILRFCQMLVGLDIFDYPPLLFVRNKFYGFLFKSKPGLSIGHNCYFIKADVLVNCNDNVKLVFGNKVAINHNVEIDYSGGISIGDEVWISQNSLIETHEHLISPGSKNDWPIIRSGLIDYVWIGANVVVLSSVNKIGRGAVIAAGAVLTKDVAPFTLFAGVPARKVRDLKEYDIETNKNEINVWSILILLVKWCLESQ